jgi:hypothetical protein
LAARALEPEPELPPIQLSPVTRSNAMLAKAVYPWLPPNSNPGDLTFKVGTVIEVVNVDVPGGGWWTGHLLGEHASGIFPGNYVKEI